MTSKTCLDMLDIMPQNSTEYFSSQSVSAKAFCLHVMCLYLKYPWQCLLKYENILSGPRIRNKLNVFGYVDCIFFLFVRNAVAAGI